MKLGLGPFMHAQEKNQNKEKPECKNHRMSFHRIKIEAGHKDKNEILNIFTRAFQKMIRFVAFSQLELIRPNQLSEADYKPLSSTP